MQSDSDLAKSEIEEVKDDLKVEIYTVTSQIFHNFTQMVESNINETNLFMKQLRTEVNDDLTGQVNSFNRLSAAVHRIQAKVLELEDNVNASSLR